MGFPVFVVPCNIGSLLGVAKRQYTTNTDVVTLDFGIYDCDTTNTNLPTTEEGFLLIVLPTGTDGGYYRKAFIAIGEIYINNLYWGRDYEGYSIQWAKCSGTPL